MTEGKGFRIAVAINDFRRARRRASLERVLARVTGRSVELLSYEEVREKLRAVEEARQTLRDIPLDAIVGSVGRYSDFTRSFLPRRDSDEGRWARVKAAVVDLEGVPPIEVYQVGEAYFVRDGNHRVSIARQLGATHIQAYVTEVHTKVQLSPDDEPDDLILKAEYTEFLDNTRIDQLYPEADLTVTAPGQYKKIEEHIQVHRYFMGLEQQRSISYDEAVSHWYEQVYLPVVGVIRERGILRDFPDRTEADLYLWVSEHRATLAEGLGQDIRTELAAEDLASRFSPKAGRVVSRIHEKVLDAVTPDELESGPPAGSWRDEFANGEAGPLFADILVGLSGDDVGWNALEQGLHVARREGARLHGVHIVDSEEEKESEEARRVRQSFDTRCEEAGIEGKLILDVGEVSRSLCDRARYNDLVIVNLTYPPAPQPLAKLSSGFRTLIRRCPRPILAVPGVVTDMMQGLLAYDGSPKAEEALFVATYLAMRWKLALSVVTVQENGLDAPAMLDRARAYLELYDIQADLFAREGTTAACVLEIAEERGSDLIIMGGYGAAPVVEVVLGSAVDQVLRESRKPMLICR